MVDVRYVPAAAGEPWRVAVAPGAVVALPPNVSIPTLEAVWRRLGERGIGAVIEALTGAFGTSLAAIPDFVLAIVEDGALRVAVRGGVELVVETSDGTHAVSGVGVATWAERHLPAAARASALLAERADDAVSLPVAQGIVAAASFALTIDAASRGGAGLPVGRDAAAPLTAGGMPSATDGAATDAAADAAEEPADPPAGAEPVPAAAAVAVPEDPTPPILPPLAEELPDDLEAGAVVTGVPTPSQPAAPDAVPEPILPPLDDTVAPGETVGPVAATLPAATTGAAPAAAVPPMVDAPPPPDPSDADAQMMWGDTIARPAPVPADDATVVAGASPVPADAAVDVRLGDHDGETVAVADIRALRRGGEPVYDSTEIAPPRRVDRGRLRVSDGQVVELEHTVIVGRRPRSPRASGDTLPTLVAVDSPQQDISRNHVEIRAEGEHVLAVDLDTTNGTTLLRGGNDPVRLHPNEPTMIVSGDVLDLGDGITIEFEDLP